MYAFGEPSSDEDDGEAETGSTSYMTNTSQVDVAALMTPELARRFPLFAQDVVPHAMQAVLEPGDLLVMPPGCVATSRPNPPYKLNTVGGTRSRVSLSPSRSACGASLTSFVNLKFLTLEKGIEAMVLCSYT